MRGLVRSRRRDAAPGSRSPGGPLRPHRLPAAARGPRRCPSRQLEVSRRRRLRGRPRKGAVRLRASHPRPVAALASNGVVRIRAVGEHWCRGIQDAGGAGSLVLLNCRAIHGSAPNRLDRSRPLLLIEYSSADSWPCTANPIPSALSGEVIRGARGGPRSIPWDARCPPTGRRATAARGRTRPSRAGRREDRRARSRDTDHGASVRLHVDEGRRHLLASEGGRAARDRRCDLPGTRRARPDGPGG